MEVQSLPRTIKQKQFLLMKRRASEFHLCSWSSHSNLSQGSQHCTHTMASSLHAAIGRSSLLTLPAFLIPIHKGNFPPSPFSISSSDTEQDAKHVCLDPGHFELASEDTLSLPCLADLHSCGYLICLSLRVNHAPQASIPATLRIPRNGILIP